MLKYFVDPILANSLLSVANRVYDHFSDRVNEPVGLLEDKLVQFDSFLDSRMIINSPLSELTEVRSLVALDSLIATKEREMEYSPEFQKVLAVLGDENSISVEIDATTGRTLLFGKLGSMTVPEGEGWASFHELLGELQALYSIREDQILFPTKPIGESIKVGLESSSEPKKWAWNRS